MFCIHITQSDFYANISNNIIIMPCGDFVHDTCKCEHLQKPGGISERTLSRCRADEKWMTLKYSWIWNWNTVETKIIGPPYEIRQILNFSMENIDNKCLYINTDKMSTEFDKDKVSSLTTETLNLHWLDQQLQNSCKLHSGDGVNCQIYNKKHKTDAPWPPSDHDSSRAKIETLYCMLNKVNTFNASQTPAMFECWFPHCHSFFFF